MLKNAKYFISLSFVLTHTQAYALTYAELEHEVVENERSTFYLGAKKVKVIALSSSDKKAFIKEHDRPSERKNVRAEDLSLTNKFLGMENTKTIQANLPSDIGQKSPQLSNSKIIPSKNESQEQTKLNDGNSKPNVHPTNAVDSNKSVLEKLSILETKLDAQQRELQRNQNTLEHTQQKISDIEFNNKNKHSAKKFRGIIPVFSEKSKKMEYVEADLLCIESAITCTATHLQFNSKLENESVNITVVKQEIIPTANESDLLKSQFCIDQEIRFNDDLSSTQTQLGRVKGIYGSYPNLKAMVRTSNSFETKIISLSNPSISIVSTPSTSVCNANLVTYTNEFTGTLPSGTPSPLAEEYLGMISNRIESGKGDALTSTPRQTHSVSTGETETAR